MSLHTEINFENDVCDYLAAHGWLYEPKDAARYDRARALFPDDVIAWVQATQAKSWETVVKNAGQSASDALLTRLRTEIDKRGTLDVLRHGIEMIGLREKITLAQFRPASRSTPTSKPGTPPTASASYGRFVTHCITRTASTWCSSSTACPSPRSS